MPPFARGFKRPSAKQSLDAVDTPRVPAPREIHALIRSDACPPAVPAPRSEDDWLAQYVEPGQTMAEFLGTCPWLGRRKRKYYRGTFVPQGENTLAKYPGAKIALLPLGDMSVGNTDGPSMQALRRYTETFYYGIEVVVLPAVEVVVPSVADQPVLWRSCETGSATAEVALPHRRHGKRIQLQIDGVLAQLRTVNAPGALMVIAVTMHELFDSSSDLFVAGMAAGLHNVAVFSFTRYHPQMIFSAEHWWKISMPRPTTAPSRKSKRKRSGGSGGGSGAADEEARVAQTLLLARSCKLLVHEVGHLLGLDHCIHFACCMNGSGHLQEDYAQPAFLCPVCLHKAHALFGFSIRGRYAAMADFFGQEGLVAEEQGARRLLAAVSSSSGGEAKQQGGAPRRLVRGRVAAGPDTVDLTLALPDGIDNEPAAAGVICVHSPVACVRGGNSRSNESVRDGEALRTQEDNTNVPLRDRIAARMAACAHTRSIAT